MRDDARLNNIRPIVRVFSKKKKSKQKCGLYTRLDAFRDRFASLVTSFRTDCERKCDLVSRGPTCATAVRRVESKYFHAEIIYSFWWKKKCSFIRNDSYKKGTWIDTWHSVSRIRDADEATGRREIFSFVMLPICAKHDAYSLSYKGLNIFVCTCSRIDDTYPSGDEWVAGRRPPSVGVVDTRLAFLERRNESEYNSAARTLLPYPESLLRREHVFSLQTPRSEIIVFWKYLLRFRTLWGSKAKSTSYASRSIRLY